MIPQVPKDRISIVVSAKYSQDMSGADAVMHPCEGCREALALSLPTKQELLRNPMLVPLCLTCAQEINGDLPITGVMPGTEAEMAQFFGPLAGVISHAIRGVPIREAT